MGRAPRPGEPLWTQDDADLAVALLDIEADQCPHCGWDRAISMDPANEHAFTAEAVRCHSCAARERASRDASAPTDDAGVSWTTRKKVTGG